MISRTRRSFWVCFASLPSTVQKIAKSKFHLWRDEPFHPSLHFKPLRSGVWSVRVNDNYRAMGLREGDLIVWFWIGTHGEYDRLLKG